MAGTLYLDIEFYNHQLALKGAEGQGLIVK